MTRAAIILRKNGLRATIALVIGATTLVGCKGADNATAKNAPIGMQVGPENIAVVKAEQIRSGPAISGNLEAEAQATVRAEVGGAVLRTLAEQGDRVSAGRPLAQLDDATLRAQELAARSAVSRSSVSSRSGCHAGSNSATILAASQVANPSLSQMSSHHAVVTRSPNHWWASSWDATLTHASRSHGVICAGSRMIKREA